MYASGTSFVGDHSPSWHDLKFNATGLLHLRQKLATLTNEPGISLRYRSAFEAADISWFAAGTHNDGLHLVPPSTFHPMFHTAREHSSKGEQGNKERNALREKVRASIFDLITMYDRVYGSTTFLAQIDGTTAPRCPSLPEYLKAHVYVPPTFISEFPQTHPHIALIVQLCIEHLGVPTVTRWKAAARALGWPLTQEGPSFNTSAAHQPLIPQPVSPTSSHYIFKGRPLGSFQDPLSQALPDPSPQPPRSPRKENTKDDLHSSSAMTDLYDNDDGDLLANYAEANAALQAELNEVKKKEVENERLVQSLRKEIRRLGIQLRDLRQQESEDEEPRLSASVSTNINQHRGFSHRSAPALPQQVAVLTPKAQHTAIFHSPNPSTPISSPSSMSSGVPSSPTRYRTTAAASFGPFTAAVVDHYGINSSIHRSLKEIVNSHLQKSWLKMVAAMFEEDEPTSAGLIAQDLIGAMMKDLADVKM